MATERRAAVWFLRNGAVHWLAFVLREDAPYVARRVLTMFGCPAFVADYWWEPEEWQRPLPSERRPIGPIAERRVCAERAGGR